MWWSMVLSAWRRGQRSGWIVRCDQWPQQPVVKLGVEDRDALPVGGQEVGVAAGQPHNEALELEPGQVVAHLGGRVGHAEQGAHLGAQAPVGEPSDNVQAGAQRADQGHDRIIDIAFCYRYAVFDSSL